MSHLFTADHNGFYKEGQPFFPLIQEGPSSWSNTAVIRLPAHLHDDLDWSKQIDSAQAAGKYLLWEIDLGLDKHPFDPQDTTAFYSFSLALEEFSTKIWPSFSHQTLGVAVYRGGFDPAFSFPLSQWEQAYTDWAQEMPPDYSLFCAQQLADYLHRLVSFLPEVVLPFAMIDVSAMASPAKIAQLFSKERFEHTHLILKGMHSPFTGITWEEGHMSQGWMGQDPRENTLSVPTLGVCLPKDSLIDASTLQQLDALIASLKGTPFRMIAEEKLTEQWDGLDRLIVLDHAVSPQGRRKLCGFAAAGGTITSAF